MLLIASWQPWASAGEPASCRRRAALAIATPSQDAKPAGGVQNAVPGQTYREALAEAFAHRSFVLLYALGINVLLYAMTQ